MLPGDATLWTIKLLITKLFLLDPPGERNIAAAKRQAGRLLWASLAHRRKQQQQQQHRHTCTGFPDPSRQKWQLMWLHLPATLSSCRVLLARKHASCFHYVQTIKTAIKLWFTGCSRCAVCAKRRKFKFKTRMLKCWQCYFFSCAPSCCCEGVAGLFLCFVWAGDVDWQALANGVVTRNRWWLNCCVDWRLSTTLKLVWAHYGP